MTVAERFYATFCEQYLSPVLTPVGFERSGLTHRRRDDRTWRIVTVTPHAGYRLPAHVFDLEIGIYVVPDRPWLSGELRADLDAVVPEVWNGQFRARLLVPPEHRHDPLSPTAWGTVSDEDVTRAGREIRHIVTAEAVPCLDAVIASGNGPGADEWPSLDVGTVQQPFRDKRTSHPPGDPLYQW